MHLITDHRVRKFLHKINKRDSAKVVEYIELFEKYGFQLNQRYLKKISGSVWELRPGKIRLFLFAKLERFIVIHVNYKKSQKIRKEDLMIIEKRSKDYL